jgi:hypothetical protein
MALACPQVIQLGAAVLLFGTPPTNVICDAITTNINQSTSPSGYSATATSLIVDSAATIAPDVWETTAGTIGNPPVVDVICVTRTGELMFCYKRTTGTNTIYVVRGCGIYWTKRDVSLTQYNVALLDNDELQLLGSFTMPDMTSATVTVDDVVIDATQANVSTKDNQKGQDATYTSDSAVITLTASLPRNTLPETKRLIGIQTITDGNTPAKYFTELGNTGAGVELPSKFIIVVPNDVFFSKPTLTIGGVNYLDFSKCWYLPKAQFDLNASATYSNGSQLNLTGKWMCAFSEAWQKPGQQSGVKDMMRLNETA